MSSWTGKLSGSPIKPELLVTEEELDEEWLMCQRIMWGEHISFQDYWEAYDRSREIEIMRKKAEDSAAASKERA